MKRLLLLSLLLWPLLAFSQPQGTAVRALNGFSTNQFLFDGSAVLSMKPGLRRLYDAGGTVFSIEYDARVAYDTVGVGSVLWSARQLNDSAAAASMNWEARTFSGTSWIFLSTTNHNDAASTALLSDGYWKYNGSKFTTARLTNTFAGFTKDGGGGTLSVGQVNGAVTMAHSGTITGWSISAGGSSPTCTIDVWKIATGTALPTVANTIMGTKPALAAGNAVRSSALTGWTATTYAAGDIIIFSIDATANATWITFALEGYQ